MKFTIHSLPELHTIATTLVSELIPGKTATIIALQGNLGAGKTTFTQALAKAFKVEEHITSPTFVIEKIYKLNDNRYEHLIHIDAYRLESGKELETLGWHDIASNSKNCIVIEWPERVKDLNIIFNKKISFTFIDETTREIEVE